VYNKKTLTLYLPNDNENFILKFYSIYMRRILLGLVMIFIIGEDIFPGYRSGFDNKTYLQGLPCYKVEAYPKKNGLIKG